MTTAGSAGSGGRRAPPPTRRGARLAACRRHRGRRLAPAHIGHAQGAPRYWDRSHEAAGVPEGRAIRRCGRGGAIVIRDPGGRPPCRIPRARCERYIAEGLTVAQMAVREGWSVSTVHRHLLALGLRMRSRAVVRIEDLLSIAAGRETGRDVCERLTNGSAASPGSSGDCRSSSRSPRCRSSHRFCRTGSSRSRPDRRP